MSEPAVVLTDYGLAVLCGVLAYLLSRGGRFGGFRGWFIVFYVATGAAAAFGGTAHGFFPDEGSVGGAVVWRLTLISIGAATLAGWGIGATLLLGPRIRRWVIGAAALQVVAYAWIVSFVTQDFLVAVLEYLPAAVLLLAGFSVVAWRERARPLLVAAAGMLLTFAAAAVQQLGIALHPVYLDHNVLYHLIQAVALVMIFAGATHLAGGRPSMEGVSSA